MYSYSFINGGGCCAACYLNENGINRYAGQKTLNIFLGPVCYYLSSVALETSHTL